MNWLRAALLLAGLPVLFETVLFFTWYGTGWSWWERAWLWALLLDIGCLLAGAVCLVRYFRTRKLENPDQTSGWLRPALAIALMLFSLPLGAAYMWAALRVASAYTVEVCNESALRIDSLLVSGPPVGRVELGPIPAGVRSEKRLHLTGDGTLRYSGRQGALEHEGTLDSSASPVPGGWKRIVIKSDGHWEVQRTARP